jgi:hypothetical protein
MGVAHEIKRLWWDSAVFRGAWQNDGAEGAVWHRSDRMKSCKLSYNGSIHISYPNIVVVDNVP